MLASAMSAINFFILVLSNVASKLLRANLGLNKAKTSKIPGITLLQASRNTRIQHRALRRAVLGLGIVSLHVVLDSLA